MELVVDIRKKLPGFMLDVKFQTGTEPCGLLGASGSGKSMTLRCIAGLEKPDEGKIILNGRVLFDSVKKINLPSRKRRIGLLFQNYALFPNMTVEENIGFALNDGSMPDRQNMIKSMIEMVRLQGMEKKYPHQLSGGQQQRVAMARALAIEPEVLLLDEPFSALDDHLRSHMVKQLIDMISEYHGITVFVSHNMEEAYRVCERLVVLSDGRVEAHDEKEELFQKPPSVAVARLTGCKNLTAAKIFSESLLFSKEWGIYLNSFNALNMEMKYLGIRANYIRLAQEGESENVFECWPSYINEAPFKMTIYLSIGKEPENSQDYQLQWEVSKERWQELQGHPKPWKICLDARRLMVFEK